MIPENPRDGAFIVRIWWEQGLDRAIRWRGRIVHVQTHHSVYFDDVSDMNAFIEKWSGIQPSSMSSQDQPQLKNENK